MSELSGLRVFAIEDESLVAMQLEDIFEDLGLELAGFAMRVPRALDMLASAPRLDVAVLDMNIAGEKVYPVAERLRELGVPIVFATGYGRGGLLPDWQIHPVLQKPYTADQVAEAILDARVNRRFADASASTLRADPPSAA